MSSQPAIRSWHDVGHDVRRRLVIATGGDPKWVALHAELRRRIEAGTYPVGEPFPSIRQLEYEFDDVANSVVRRAVAKLVEQGMVSSEPKVRRVVLAASPARRRERPSEQEQIEELRQELAATNERLARVEERLGDGGE